ncbi:MAG TPA: helix-turn-helix transcriptional regulator [Bacillales bacterium]|nr:helix-turn-helix transcriptional regulator [Bacillales bacterium]
MEAEQWGRKIRAFRKLKGHTQESLAKELHVSVSVLGEIERGNRLPSDEFLGDIADILNITVEDLTPEEKRNA